MVDVADGPRTRARRPATALTSFVGRESDLERLRDELGARRLVTLTGPGGVGKTRLAVTLAADADGPAYVVELAAVTDPSQIAPAVATALGVPDQSNRDAVDRVIDHLTGAPALLVVDNCEHLIEGSVGLLRRLLDALPDLTVLATSRESLGLWGEQVHRLAPLPVPGDLDAAGSRSLDDVPAVRLLVDRARSVLPEFAITPANRAAVVELCRRLDGLPLAIELAAVRLRTLPVAQVVERLGGRLHLLKAPVRDAEPRHRSLHALIDWSFDLCGPDERLLWARMSVFPASVDLETLDGVCGHGELAGDRLLEALDGLVAKSVVLADRDGESVRYRQFVPLREYGAEQLDRSGETEDVRRRHRDHFIRRAEGMIARWCGPDQARDLAQLRADHPNLIAALAFSADTPGEAVAGARLAALLRYHWIAGGFLTYGRRWLERLLRRLDAGTEQRGHALWVVAWVALIQGDPAEARVWLEESRHIAAERGDLAMQGHAAHWTALLHLFEGDLDEAIGWYRQAIPLHRRGELGGPELTAAFQLAMAQTYAGRSDEALATAAEVVERATAAGELWNRGYGRWIAAISHLHLGELDRAREAILATMQIERDFRDGVCTALSIEVCSWISVASGRAADAATLSGLARSVWRRLGTSLAAFGPHASAEGQEHATRIDAALGTARAEALRAEHADVDLADAVRLCITLTGSTSAPPDPCPRDTGPLTSREREIAALIADGRSNRDIADELVISRRTVDGHVERILRKLSFTSRTQIASWVASRGQRDGVPGVNVTGRAGRKA
ncbi:ATP-binding protein [Actinomycetospora flava]|uniref:LuxR C-terminal-related transcriptional regulator n=1 Tax=Actinomycetospora flava TaxID=3129232 RepID=A0ABU8M304_9PSEU